METVTAAGTGFQHEALFYQGDHGFIAGTSTFIEDGLARNEDVLVVVGARKIDMLRDALGDSASRVTFADMEDVGRNPARIIPAWYDFVAEETAKGRTFRGVGEPIFPSRSPAEMVECQRHESLLNLAFAGSAEWRLQCPYDTAALPPEVIDEARRSHPVLTNGTRVSPSPTYGSLDAVVAPFDAPLPPPPDGRLEVTFAREPLDGLRSRLFQEALTAGFTITRATDLVVAANEVVSNSIRHGGGGGTLRLWRDDHTLVCEVADAGRIADPLVGRRRPRQEQERGRGLWLANQLCDLVQVRTFRTGSVVRLHMRTRSASARA